MPTTPTNNSATPPALRHYIPDHLLVESKRDYYENPRILVELHVRSVELSVETSHKNPHGIPTVRVSALDGIHLDVQGTRALALALLQLADVQEAVAREGGAA